MFFSFLSDFNCADAVEERKRRITRIWFRIELKLGIHGLTAKRVASGVQRVASRA